MENINLESLDAVFEIIASENPIVAHNIEKMIVLIEQSRDLEEAQLHAVIGVIALYGALRTAMQRTPDIIVKSDNDALPTLNEKTAQACIKDHEKGYVLSLIVQKIEQMNAEMPGMKNIIDYIMRKTEQTAQDIRLNSSQTEIMAGNTLTSIVLVYQALKAQAENNKIQKILGEDFGRDLPPPPDYS